MRIVMRDGKLALSRPRGLPPRCGKIHRVYYYAFENQRVLRASERLDGETS